MKIKGIFSKIFKGFALKAVAFTALFVVFSNTSYAQHYQPVYYSGTDTVIGGPSANRVYQVPNYGKQYQQQMKKQYRQSKTYDTLADTGTYFAIGISKGKNIGDAMKMDISDATIVGNNSGDNPYAENDSTAFDVAVGLMVSSNVRFELNYINYQGLSYGNAVQFYDGTGIMELPVISGGDIKSDVFMLSLYYSLEELFGNFAGGKIIPYVGFGVGMAFNQVNTYTISDVVGFPITDDCYGGPSDYAVYDTTTGLEVMDGICTYLYDGMITHDGASKKNLAYRLELGATWKLQNQMFFDFYFRYSLLGQVESSGVVVQDYLAEYPYEDMDNIGPYWYDANNNGTLDDTDPYIQLSDGQETTTSFGAKEKGDLSITELGVRFRIMF